MTNQPNHQAELDELHRMYKNNDNVVDEKMRLVELTLTSPFREQKLDALKATKDKNEGVKDDFEAYFRMIEQALSTGDITFESVTDGKFEVKVAEFKKQLQDIANNLKP